MKKQYAEKHLAAETLSGTSTYVPYHLSGEANWKKRESLQTHSVAQTSLDTLEGKQHSPSRSGQTKSSKDYVKLSKDTFPRKWTFDSIARSRSSRLGMIKENLQVYATRIRTNKQDTKDHRCNLPGEPKDILSKYIEVGIFVRLRRFIRRTMMINVKHPYTKYYASSITKLKEEEYRHLITNYHMIHPLSMFTFYFEMVMFFVLTFVGVFCPVIIMIYRGNKAKLYGMFLPINVLRAIMIGLSFCTGFYDIKHNRVIMKRRQVAILYLRSYFFFDVLTILPQILRGGLAMKAGINYDIEHRTVSRYLSTVFLMCHYARYLWCLRILKQMRLYYEMSTYVFKIIRLILNSITIIIISVYVLFVLMHALPGYMKSDVIKHSEHIVKMLMMVNYGPPAFKQVKETVFPIVFLLLGFVLHLLMLVHGAEIWLKFSSKDTKQAAVFNATEAYMRYRALPVNLRNRIYLYLDFKYQGQFYKESVIRRATSAALRKEILLSITKESLQKVVIFKSCPGLVLNKIRANLVSDIFLPGDIIIKAGSTGHCMFFILAGTVVITTKDDKELSYLRDGAHFGEVALVISISRVANVIAVTPCELFKLDRHHFWDVMKNYPMIWNEIKALATERVANTNRSLADVASLRRSVFSTYTQSIDLSQLELKLPTSDN